VDDEGQRTVRIDADLPTVNDMTDDEFAEAALWRDWQSIELANRPLQVGDRVTLATMQPLPDTPHHPEPFATATVTEVAAASITPHGVWLVTVTDIKENQ
jgi:hypothetical protein